MDFRSSSSPSHLRPGAFHMLYKHTTQHTQLRVEERRTNKHGLGFAHSVRREKFLALYWHSGLLCSHERVLEQNPHTATWNADSFSRAHRPGLWVHRSAPRSAAAFLWPLPFQDCRNSYLLLTALGPCLSSSSSGLVRNLTREPFVWVSHQSRQRNRLTGTHPHPRPQKRMPRIIPHSV